MEPRNYRAVESISNYCYFCGIIPLFLGILIIFIDIIYAAFDHVLVGIFMFITGYAQVKISSKLDLILKAERTKMEAIQEANLQALAEKERTKSKAEQK